MSAETLFAICNTMVLPGWLLLVVLPRWKWTTQIITSVIMPFLFGLVYLYLVLVYFGKAGGGFSSLAGVTELFQNPYVLLAGWLHYLAFDLFIGSWEVRDAQRLGISHWLIIPCLGLTFMFGPIGLGLYFVIRWTFKRKLLIEGA
ncbi:MAG: DUF4281 domain-containing protein [Caldithrix sp.]|nr:MAG: DUF4281 domain-containing protein [Caldithrix sp.]